MAEARVRLRGGSRDGESTYVAEKVRRVLAAAEAPGLLEVYEPDGTVDEDGALVFVLVAEQSSEGIAPELLHFPTHDRD